MLDDVNAYYDGGDVPHREPGELQDHIVDIREAQKLLDRIADDIRSAIHAALKTNDWRRVPEPAGKVSKYHYWMRADVVGYAPTAKRRARSAAPSG